MIIRKIIALFIGIDSLFWLCFSALIAFNLHPALPDDPITRLIMGILALGAGLAMPLLLFFSKKFNPRWSWLLLTGLAIILFLTVTDEFGWPDLIVLFTHAVPFVLLLREKINYP